MAVAEFRFLADWPPSSPDLNSLDFSISCILQVKVQATDSLVTLGPSIAVECDWLAAVYIHQNCRSFRRQQAAAKKNEV
jgi:hypothetical protein